MSKNKQLTGWQKLVRWVIIPLFVVMGITPVIFMTAGPDAARLFANLSTLLVMLVAFAYIVFFDSRLRWPGDDWRTRAAKVLTFSR